MRAMNYGKAGEPSSSRNRYKSTARYAATSAILTATSSKSDRAQISRRRLDSDSRAPWKPRDAVQFRSEWRSSYELVSSSAKGRPLSDAGCRLHLTGKFVVAGRPRVPDRGREIFPQHLFEGPEQCVPQRVVVGELDAVLDMTDGELADRRQDATRLRQIVYDQGEHGHQLDALNTHVVFE